jgi:mRNA interferase RelE/StbE
VYSVSLSDEAKRFFERASAKLQQRLDRCFEQLGTNPQQHPNIKSLKGNFAGYHRYRVGDYRVVYQIDIRSRQVFIITIVHRSKAYNN